MKAGGTHADPTEHYVRMTKQLVQDQEKWAAFVQLVIALSVLPNWRHFGLACITLVLVPLNVFVTTTLVPRFGPVVAEAVRGVTNVTLSCVVYHFIGWPTAAYLWLPYVALVADGSRRDLAYGMLAFSVAGYWIGSLADGIAWQRPFVWTAIAILCRQFTDRRVGIAHELWIGSIAAHEKLKAEVAARLRAEVELRQGQKLEAIGRLAAGGRARDQQSAPVRRQQRAARCRWRRRHRRLHRPRVTRRHPRIGRDDAGWRETRDCDRPCDERPRHPDRGEKTPTDLKREIEATLVVSRHAYAHVAEVNTHFTELPVAACYPGAIGQVVLNLVVNAAQAIAAHTDRRGRGTIALSATAEAGDAVISVTDDGGGIPAAVRDRVFEPFFTTRSAGTGTGQGLAIARSLVEAHGGTLGFVTEIGQGTTFTIRLPLLPALAEAA